LEVELEELRRESEKGKEAISKDEADDVAEATRRSLAELRLEEGDGAGMHFREEEPRRKELVPEPETRKDVGSRRSSVASSSSRASSTGSSHSAMKEFFRAQTKTLEQLQEKLAKSGKSHTKEKIKSPESYDGKYELFYNILDKIAEMENYFSQHGTDVSKWIGITNTYFTHKAKTVVTSSPFATGQGDWDDYTEYLIKYLLPRQHEDNLRAYRHQLKQLSTLTQYAELWDRLWTAFVRAGIQPDEQQWLWDIRKGLAREEDRRVIMLAVCTKVSEMTGLIRMLDESSTKRAEQKDGRFNRRDNRGSYRREKEAVREGSDSKKGKGVFSIRESDSECEEEDSEEEHTGSEEERVAIVITNLEKRELGPMTRDLRDLHKHKGLCMFCGAHSQKEGQKCPNYDRLRLASVRTSEGREKRRDGSGKSRTGGTRSGGRKKEKNFSVKESESSTEPEEDEEDEEVAAVDVRRTARSRSMSASRSGKAKNP
jgi:hypothetical protein